MNGKGITPGSAVGRMLGTDPPSMVEDRPASYKGDSAPDRGPFVTTA